MPEKPIRAILAVCLGLWVPAPAFAELLRLDFLPPDLPASNICAIQRSDSKDEESTEDDISNSAESILTEVDRLDFLARDIDGFSRQNPDLWFEFISALISYWAELDPEFAGIDEAFTRINLYIVAERFEELLQSKIVEELTAQADDLTGNRRVQLAQFYLTGLGVTPDRDVAIKLITDAALTGNANALLDIVRMLLSGEEIADWSLSPEKTATMAFGGVIGKLNAGICHRAERLAREYTDGNILAPNPELAYAWRKFAADMGGKDAAWRVVEHQLNSVTQDKNYAEIQHYLEIAVGNVRQIDRADVDQLIDYGAFSEADVKEILGHFPNRTPSVQRRTATPFLELQIELEPSGLQSDSPYLQYLREIVAIPDAPGPIHTRLAKEILLLKGKWTGESEAIPILEQAIELDDPEAMTILAKMLLRHRDDPAFSNRAEQLLIDTVSRHGHASSMKSLDGVYRCQLPNAPLLSEANFWAHTYRVADIEPVRMPATDLAKLDPTLEAEAVAKIQSLAVLGHGSSSANLLQLMQSDPLVSDRTLQFWARRVGRSNRALEDFVRQEFELALTTEQRQRAVEIFRRAYLHIGPAITLDFAVALVKHAGREPAVSTEIQQLLYEASQRGEGAAIRLLQRLTNSEGIITYGIFSEAIDANGDFLALMFAAPYLLDDEFDDYMDRAVSVMNCTSKDIAELADAYVVRGRTDDALHWLNVGLAIEDGHVLSRLGINVIQRANFGKGETENFENDEVSVNENADIGALQRSYLLTSNPNARTYDPEVAGGHLVELLDQSDGTTLLWALAQYRIANRQMQRLVEAQVNIRSIYQNAANSGDGQSKFEYGMILRAQAEGSADLAASTDWLRQAAEAGQIEAMVEYAIAIGFGLGQNADPKLAVIWLQKADSLGTPRAREMMDLFNALTRQ